MAVVGRFKGSGKVFEGDRELADVEYSLTEDREIRDGIPRFPEITGTISVTDGRPLPARDWALTLMLEKGQRADFLFDSPPSPLNKGPYRITVTGGIRG